MLDPLDRQLLLSASPAFTHATRVRFADAIGGGRLHYPKMLELVHDAYEALLEEHGVSLARVLRDRTWGAPLVHASLELLGELPTFGTGLDVLVTAVQVRQHAVSYGYRVVDHATGEPCAIATTAHAFVELAALQKLPVPDAVQALAATIPGQLAPLVPSEERKALLEAPARFTHRIAVSYDDVDAAGFVFFARTCAFLHRAYTDLRRRSGARIDEYSGKPSTRIRATEAWFLRPLKAGEEADVLVVASAPAPPDDLREGNDAPAAKLGFRIATLAGEPVAVGTLTHEGAVPIDLEG